jgi:heat shock transcription factor, other eukaryote
MSLHIYCTLRKPGPGVDHAGFWYVQGFRKVHPDRWEFAHELFLREQTHLLPRIVRRKKRGGGTASTGGGHHHLDQGDEEELVEEVQRLRQEQAAIGEELARMRNRLQATERRPDQLMAFLSRLAEDPDGITRNLMEQAAEKKRRRLQVNNAGPVVSPVPPAPPPLALGGASIDCDDWQWVDQKPAVIFPSFDPVTSSCEVQHVPDFASAAAGGGAGLIPMDHDTAVGTPFPFCLLGQGFF